MLMGVCHFLQITTIVIILILCVHMRLRYIVYLFVTRAIIVVHAAVVRDGDVRIRVLGWMCVPYA